MMEAAIGRRVSEAVTDRSANITPQVTGAEKESGGAELEAGAPFSK